MADGNGITINKGQVSFWSAVIVAIIAVSGSWYGASRPQQPEQSASRQQIMVDDQKLVIQRLDIMTVELQKLNLSLDKLNKGK